ncbi:MAG: S8 family serine peptidase [Bacteroidetes bacterium]|nr:S8 family serine peptidase [Bacteroidota bacterium]
MRKLFLLLFLFPAILSAQNKYWVFFKDKGGTEFNPYSYFVPEAIERRMLNHLSLMDSTDFPLNKNYVSAVTNLSDSLGNESRWLNGIAIYTSIEKMEKIKHLSFVKEVRLIAVHFNITRVNKDESKQEKTKDDLVTYQLHRMRGEKFTEAGFTGKGIRIAILDAGFSGADKHIAFEKIRSEKRIIATHDFIAKDDNPYKTGNHGTSVFSCIAGVYKNKNIGLAQDAEFLLARTEFETSEKSYEEDCWVAALEWADKLGARLVNSSLGYGNDRYFIEDMDGRKSVVAKGASIAAKKGMLIVNSAGNEGDSYWKYIITPADNDSVLCVGGTDPSTDYHISFSSYGPNAKKNLKPNVSAVAHVLAATPTDFEIMDGTSFSAPLTTGFVACAWQKNPGLTNMQIFKMIEHSGHLYPYYDYAHGYGIPQATWFIDSNYRNATKPTFTISDVSIKMRDTLISLELDTSYFVADTNGDLKLKNKNVFVYYHFADDAGHLKNYQLLKPESNEINLTVPQSLLHKKGMLRIHFMGYTSEFKLEELYAKIKTKE